MCYRNVQVIQSRHLVALWWIPTCGLPKKDHPVAREKRRVQTQHHNKIRQKKTLDLVISYNYLRYLNWMSQTLDLVVRTFLSISSSNVSFPSTAISSTHCLRPLATWPGRPRGPQRRTLLRRKKKLLRLQTELFPSAQSLRTRKSVGRCKRCAKCAEFVDVVHILHVSQSFCAKTS